MTPSSASRPAPRIAKPFEFQHVLYQQDREETPNKSFGAAYLSATDIESGKLLWSIKIADAIRYPPGSPWEFGPIYIEKIELGQTDGTLHLLTQHGKFYQVNVKTREVNLVFDPAEHQELSSPAHLNDTPPPPPPPPPLLPKP